MALKNTGTVGLKGDDTDLFQENREIMSHELRGLLNIIIGFTGLLLDEVPGKINDEQRRSLEDILRSGRRLLGLVEEIIDRFPPRT